MILINIEEFDFKKDLDLKNYEKAINWPVVYLIENGKQIYIGETNSFKRRMNQHHANPARQELKKVHLISDDDFNKSAILDIESALIGYFDADKKFELLNSNNGVTNQEYYDRISYKNKVPVIWAKLQQKGLAEKEIFQLENSDVFKYSPYKSLSDDQFEISQMILSDCFKEDKWLSFVEGNPGTGKTILAMYLLKILVLSKARENKNVALVVPMTSLRKTLQKVAKTIKGLSSSQVISPGDVIKKDYDVLIVDEAHRLKRRVNIVNFASFDNTNKYLGLENGTQLDWIMMSANHHIMFYDERQSIKPTDVRKKDFLDLKISRKETQTTYELISQHRVKGGSEFISYSNKIMNNKQDKKIVFKNYDAKLFDSFLDFDKELTLKENEYKLVRMVAGYSFPWISKKNKDSYDINIDGIKKKWNSTSADWVNSENAQKEVGCIHTVQGYDLNYIGLIFGSEIDYDIKNDKIVVYKDKYYDRNGKASIKDDKELKQYVVNIYTTLMSRGVKGIYMYACNENFNRYLRKYFD